ncbi:TonB-linked outer membrane protein, SusC/RagA family [Chitinophaga sp. CF118]|uniref:SusC/RagA family TonB-linked outer membrane protein n=1 Tax=Chitinophaga sp. CF118 TaxID=1884367 RepID=UPI0008EFA0C2|nr:SusC/RagA family TonB-linked outer membrane protein [Chitinophaga sp. CF118]SFD78057.1 TonB-linked outer membrane protein, SusC/RagA family [Chitinophaga sp. CF118]
MPFTVWCQHRLVTVCLLMIVSLAFSLSASAGNFQTVTLSLKNASLQKTFKEIEKQTGYSFLYSREDMEQTRNVSLEVRNVNVEAVLNICFEAQPFTYTIVDKVVIIKRKSSAPPITGTIVGPDGAPIPGANIQIKGTNTGTVTDPEGRFSLTAEVGKTLVIRIVGYETQEVKIGSETSLRIVLKISTSLLEEVIVTAGGIRSKRREIGTANTVIKTASLVAGKSVNVAGGLQGKVAGLQINATSGGVNPNYRLILRGQRSLTGNNQALIVLDNVIVPNTVLGNLNPEDVEELVVLNGAGAAALYGSQASNGAIVVTTKKGKKGVTEVKLSHTTTVESVAFFPKLQYAYGAGGSTYGFDVNGKPLFSNLENQSYGPGFDGTKVPLGEPLEDGSQDSAYYSGNKEHNNFWERGITNQTDFSVSSGDDKSTLYLSGQYAGITGTTPKDKYNRAVLRANGTHKMGQHITSVYSIAYTQTRSDLTSQTATIYSQLLNMPQNVDITKYKNWRSNKFANPNGFYNPWYGNPYFTLDNNRSKQRNDYLIGNLEIKYSPLEWLDFTGRQGISARNLSYKSWGGGFNYTTYAEVTSASKTDISAYVNDESGYTTELLTDVFTQIHKSAGDFNFNLIAGAQWRQDQSKFVGNGANGLTIPDLFNVGNSATNPTAYENNYKARQMGIYGDLRIGYKNVLFLHGTGRKDWVSILAPNNRTFFYPSVDLSFIASDAISALKDSRTISYLKLRGGWSKVGQVNLGNSSDFGAYYLQPTFSQANGYPYNNVSGYTVNNTLVSTNLKPEITKGYEVGFDLNMFQDRIISTVTWYSTKTDNQTVNTSVSNATGFSSYRVNTGQTTSRGLEVTVHVTPIKTNDFELTVGGNYTHLDNKVNNISADLPRLTLSSYTSGTGSYAVAGQPFPVIMGKDYSRDKDGHVIVDRLTGTPYLDDTIKILGNAVAKDRLSLDLSVRYKHFRLSALLEYRGGYMVYNNMGSELDWAGTGYRTAAFNRTRFVFPNSVYEDPSHPGTYIKNTNITVRDGNGNSAFWTNDENRTVASNYVTSGDFWKLREVSLSYDIPSSLLSKTRVIKNATFSLQGRNLFIWLAKSNYYTDPEYSDSGNDSNGIGLTGLGQSPPSRFYGAALSLTF